MRTLGGVPRQRGRRMLWKTFVATVVMVMVVVLAACGGGGDSGDKGKLSSLRSDAESAYSTAEAEQIVKDALAIASRNADTPLGDEAYSFAEEQFRTEVDTSYSGVESGFFTDGVPEVPSAATVDASLEEFPQLPGLHRCRTDSLPRPSGGPTAREAREQGQRRAASTRDRS